MKQDLEEKRIERLFRELRRTDNDRAPSFDNVLKATASKEGQTSLGWFSLRIRVAAMLVLASGLALFFLMRPSSHPTEPPNVQVDNPISRLVDPSPPEPPPPSEPVAAPEATRRERQRSGRRERARTESHQQAMLLSRWQSPTDFLLKTSADRLLKTVPRVGESFMEIKPILKDEKN
jgi:hypothetical protein